MIHLVLLSLIILISIISIISLFTKSKQTNITKTSGTTTQQVITPTVAATIELIKNGNFSLGLTNWLINNNTQIIVINNVMVVKLAGNYGSYLRQGSNLKTDTNYLGTYETGYKYKLSVNISKADLSDTVNPLNIEIKLGYFNSSSGGLLTVSQGYSTGNNNSNNILKEISIDMIAGTTGLNNNIYVQILQITPSTTNATMSNIPINIYRVSLTKTPL